MKFIYDEPYIVELDSEEEVDYCPDYWYCCPECGEAFNAQLSTDDPPKSVCNCRHCDIPIILCEDSDESD